MSLWKIVLELDSQRLAIAGSPDALAVAIAGGSDLRIYTEFFHNEHIDPGSSNDELVREVSDFPVTYLINNKWVAGIMTFRMPICVPDGFGQRPSMSFFMYNQNGQQAIARPFFDGKKNTATSGDNISSMKKYHTLDAIDANTNAPSSNFIYDFEIFRYMARNDWREIMNVDSSGKVISGSLEELVDAFASGCAVKVGVGGICDDLDADGTETAHELFVEAGPCYYNTRRKIFTTGTRPVVRVSPTIPMVYKHKGWDFGWLMVRNDGVVNRWLCDPYTLEFKKSQTRNNIRWFVR
jgi:hypothetical protein